MKKIEMNDADLELCRLSIVEKEGGGYCPGKYESTQHIYHVLQEWEIAHNATPRHLVLMDIGRRTNPRSRLMPAPNIPKQEVFRFIREKKKELREIYREYCSQQDYSLQHGNLNGYDGTSECAVCGAVLTGEAKTAQYAYANGEKGRKIHHLHVGNKHFCNLDCFEKYKAMYNQQLNTPKYAE